MKDVPVETSRAASGVPKSFVLSTIPRREVERSVTSIKHGEIVSRPRQDNVDAGPNLDKERPRLLKDLKIDHDLTVGAIRSFSCQVGRAKVVMLASLKPQCTVARE